MIARVEQNEFAEALQEFKAGKGLYPPAEIAQSTDLLVAMLRALYAEGHVDAAFTFVEIYIGQVDEQTHLEILEVLLLLVKRKVQELSKTVVERMEEKGDDVQEIEDLAELWMERLDGLEDLIVTARENSPRSFSREGEDNDDGEPKRHPADMRYEDKGSQLPKEYQGLQTGTILEVYEDNAGLLQWDGGEVDYQVPGHPPYESQLVPGAKVRLVWVDDHGDILPQILGLAL